MSEPENQMPEAAEVHECQCDSTMITYELMRIERDGVEIEELFDWWTGDIAVYRCTRCNGFLRETLP